MSNWAFHCAGVLLVLVKELRREGKDVKYVKCVWREERGEGEMRMGGTDELL